MRRLSALILLLAGCNAGGDGDAEAPSATTARGPDPILLRIPRAGGVPRAVMYPNLDSTIWRGAMAASVSRVLGFDAEAGIVAYVDARGGVGRLDLRTGEARSAARPALRAPASANGSDIYGVAPSGSISRTTPAGGSWTFAPVGRAQMVFPQANGSLVVVAPAERETSFWLLRPPDDSIIAARRLPGRLGVPTAQAGDRIYFTTAVGLSAIRVRDLSPMKDVRLSDSVLALAPTPSGDRVYAITRGGRSVMVIDRYAENVRQEIRLPGAASDIRMDPLGRYLLVRHAGADSAWVIALGTNRTIGAVTTRWRGDLPTFAPDGRIVTVRGRDAVLVEAETLTPVDTVSGGAADFWYFFSWNGFRPRALGLDDPVSFSADSVVDSAGLTSASSTPPAPAPAAAADTNAAPAVTPAAAAFTLSFAALLSEAKARELSESITVDGARPRVVGATRAGATIYRVVLGPFSTREEAERVGRQSGRQFWVYEGAP